MGEIIIIVYFKATVEISYNCYTNEKYFKSTAAPRLAEKHNNVYLAAGLFGGDTVNLRLTNATSNFPAHYVISNRTKQRTVQVKKHQKQ